MSAMGEALRRSNASIIAVVGFIVVWQLLVTWLHVPTWLLPILLPSHWTNGLTGADRCGTSARRTNGVVTRTRT